MTVSTTETSIQALANGSATVFNFPFPIYEAADLIVGQIDGSGTYTLITTGFTVQGVGAPLGGSITFTTAPLAPLTIDIRTVVDDTQPASIGVNGKFLANVLEGAFDRITRVVQDIKRLGYFFGIHGPDTESVEWPALPAAAVRAGGSLIFDANGLPAIGTLPSTVMTNAILLGLLADKGYLYKIHPAETVVGLVASQLTFGFYPGEPARYGADLTGGIDASTALQTAVNVGLALGYAGIPVHMNAGSYKIVTPPTFGSSTTAMLNLVIYGDGWGTEVYNYAPASTAATFDMGTRDGWKIRSMSLWGNSANKNNGIQAGDTGDAEQIGWEIDDVLLMMAGVGLQIADTNSGVVRNCKVWPNNPPVPTIAQSVTVGDISHHIWMKGGFVNNVSIYDCDALPSHNFLGGSGNNGIRLDCSASLGVEVIGCDVESYGSPTLGTEVGLNVASAGAVQNLTVMDVYHEGTILQFSNLINSNIIGTTDGGSHATPGTLSFAGTCRNNNIIGCTADVISDSQSSSYGNTFTGCNARTTWTDNTGTSTTPPDRRINCLAAGVLVPDWGGSMAQTIAYPGTGTFTPNGLLGNYFRLVVNDGSNGAIALPTNIDQSKPFYIEIANVRGGGASLGTFTFASGYKMVSNTPTMPADGKNRIYGFVWDTAHMKQFINPVADVAN